MPNKTTPELEKYVKNLYEKLKSVAEEDGIYEPLKIYFTNDMKTVSFKEGTYCYADAIGYHSYVYERGETLGLMMTESLFEISFATMKASIINMSRKFKTKNDVAGQDFRRVMFPEQLKLWREIGEEYYERAKKELEEVLKNNPYEDKVSTRFEDILKKGQQ